MSVALTRGGSNYLSALLRYYCANAIAVINAILQDLAVLPHVHIAFATQQHQIAIITEVIVPLDCLLVGPVRPVLSHLLIRHQIEIGPEVDRSFIKPLVARFLFKIPDWLFHTRFVVAAVVTELRAVEAVSKLNL